VLRQIKKNHPNVQVIILTAHGSTKKQNDANKHGAYAYLDKPTCIDKLVDALNGAWNYKKTLESTMAAVAFAEAGEFDTARKIIDDE